MDWIEDLLTRLTELLTNPPCTALPARSHAQPAPDLGPGLFSHANVTGATYSMRSALWQNPSFVFDGDWMQGRVFIHSVQTYAWLLLEPFMESGEYSEEKLIQFAMSFMAKDSAQQ